MGQGSIHKVGDVACNRREGRIWGEEGRWGCRGERIGRRWWETAHTPLPAEHTEPSESVS